MTDFGARRPQGDGHTSHTADEVLRELPPQLTILLARLAGDNLKDLSTTFEYMPYAFRAIMSAYEMIDLGKPRAGRPRLVKAKPFCLEVTAAAANFVASLVGPEDVTARFAADAGQGGGVPAPYVPVLDDETPTEMAGTVSFDAVIQPAGTPTGAHEYVLVISASSGDHMVSIGAPESRAVRIRSDLSNLDSSKSVKVRTPLSSLLIEATISDPSHA